MLRSGCGIIGDEPARRVLDTIEISRRDVLCVFDYRRYRRHTIAAARVARERGAEIVVFADPWLSPAAEHARHVLIRTWIRPRRSIR